MDTPPIFVPIQKCDLMSKPTVRTDYMGRKSHVRTDPVLLKTSPWRCDLWAVNYTTNFSLCGLFLASRSYMCVRIYTVRIYASRSYIHRYRKKQNDRCVHDIQTNKQTNKQTFLVYIL